MRTEQHSNFLADWTVKIPETPLEEHVLLAAMSDENKRLHDSLCKHVKKDVRCTGVIRLTKIKTVGADSIRPKGETDHGKE
jgi:hypothetical protein